MSALDGKHYLLTKIKSIITCQIHQQEKYVESIKEFFYHHTI